MKKLSWLFTLLFLCSIVSTAQVDEIKKKSNENSANQSSGSSSGSDRGRSGSGNGLFMIFDMFRLFGVWQSNVLQKRQDIPSMVGLDLMVHGAIQPSSYYIINPRIRGTWGIFSSDFRTNYMVEEALGGDKYLFSYDWQILQLNFVNTKNVIARAGIGTMKEGFSDNLTFMETTLSTNLMLSDNQWGGFAEYRAARDYSTGAVPRREFALQVHRQLFASGRWHGLASGGLQFQRYYSAVNVWGMQLGMVFRLY